MAIPSTDPSALASLRDVSCFNCIVPIGMQDALATYLLAVTAGVDTSQAGIQALVSAAAPFESTIPPNMQLAVQNFLLTQLLS